MQTFADTLRVSPQVLVSEAHSQACLVHIYPSGPNMGARYPLGKEDLVLGRDAECGICIPEASVSRVHMRVQPGDDGFYAVDLDSTNGTFVNDHSVSRCR